MKSVKKIALSAAIALATAFTFSCSSNESEEGRDICTNELLGCPYGSGTLSSSSSPGSSSSSAPSNNGGSSSSSGSNDYGDEQLLQMSNASYKTGNPPTGQTGTLSVDMGSTIISGGTAIVTVTSSRELDILYIQISGNSGYYLVELLESYLVSSSGGTYVYSVPLQFGQDLRNGTFSLTISGAMSSQVSPAVVREVETMRVGSGALQISLSWDKPVDLDLHVTTPSGGTIYFANKTVGNGTLDLDMICKVGNENVFFTAPLVDGDYTVAVNLYSKCSQTVATKYVVSAYSNGEIFDFSAANQRGEFASSVANSTKRTIGVIRVQNGVPVQVGGGGDIVYGELYDTRDEQTYTTVVIGDQTWMAENLNYDVPDNSTDVCFQNEPDNCIAKGRLYNLATAKVACPTGWRLPTDDDWDTLIDYVGGGIYSRNQIEGKKRLE